MNKIAAAFGRDLVLWSPPVNIDRPTKSTVVYHLSGIKSLAFDSSGNFMAAGVDGLTRNELQIWSIKHVYGIMLMEAQKFPKTEPYETIRAICWDPNNEFILM